MNRWMLALATLAGVVFVGLAIALRAGVVGNEAAGGARPVRQDVGLGTAVDRRPPPVRLRDAAGRPTTLRGLRGKWVVLAPSMTLCHEVCPLTTAALLRLRRLVAAAGGGRRLAVVEVSVDPWRDTPRRLRAYRRLTGADFPLLTGDRASLRRLWRFFGVHFAQVAADRPPERDWLTGRRERFDVEHTDGAFVLDPRGVERLAIPGMPALGGRVAAPLAALLDREGRRNLRDPTPGWSAVALARRLERMMGLTRPHPATGAPTLVTGEGLGEALAALAGRPAVVNVWASWCPPCREELPFFAAAERHFGDRVAFRGADLEDNDDSARALLRKVGADYPSYPVDAAELASLLAPVEGTPVTFFLDRSGQVVDQHIGAYRSPAELEADLLRHSAAR